MEKVAERLRELTGKKHIVLTRRGNKAIKFSLEALKNQGKRKVLIQDQGGWLTYAQYAETFKLEVVELKTDAGLVDSDNLKSKADADSILLINSMPGYFVMENMEKIYDIAKQADALLVNDASGSLGSAQARVGDIIVGSFGKWKPVDAGYGGFIAFDEDYFGEMESVFPQERLPLLLEKLEHIDQRIKGLKELSQKVKNDLKDFDVIHRDGEGFNVIVRFKDEQEKEKIINYCDENELEYTLCPRYIRVNEEAVSIEVKRKEV